MLYLVYIINICAINNILSCNSSSSGTGNKKSGFVFEGVWQVQPEDNEYEILYLEFVMASWNLSGTPWNAYHSAIALRPIHTNNMDGGKSFYDNEALVADYSPEETDEIRHVNYRHQCLDFPNAP